MHALQCRNPLLPPRRSTLARIPQAKKAGAEGMPWVPRANDDESDADPLTEDELQNAEKARRDSGRAHCVGLCHCI